MLGPMRSLSGQAPWWLRSSQPFRKPRQIYVHTSGSCCWLIGSKEFAHWLWLICCVQILVNEVPEIIVQYISRDEAALAIAQKVRRKIVCVVLLHNLIIMLNSGECIGEAKLPQLWDSDSERFAIKEKSEHKRPAYLYMDCEWGFSTCTVLFLHPKPLAQAALKVVYNIESHGHS